MTDIEKLVKKIQFERDMTIEQIAAAIDYSRSYFTTQLKKGNPEILKLLLAKFEMEIEHPVPSSKPDDQSVQPYLVSRRHTKIKHSAPLMVPFIPIKAQAGYAKALDHQLFADNLEHYALPPGINPNGAIWRYWEIEGDSMEDTFSSGDIILTSQVNQLDWEENLKDFYVYVIVTDDQVLCKRIAYKSNSQLVLISDNEELYEQMLLDIENLRELWIYRRTFSSKAKPPRRFKIKV